MRIFLFAAALFVLAALASCRSGGPGTGEQNLPVVQVVRVSIGTLARTIPVHGTLVPTPNHETVIRPPFSGILSRIFVAPNQIVRKGELLAQMSVRTLEGEAEQARADLAAGEMQVSQAEAGAIQQRTSTSTGIAQAQAQLAAARAKLAFERQSFVREQKLYQAGVVSQKDLQAVELSEKEAVAVVEADMEALTAAKASIQSNAIKQEEIEVAREKVKNARGRLSSVLATISLSQIRSPIEGTVAAVEADSGEMVSEGSTILTVVDTRSLQLVAAIQASDLASVRTGDKVIFTVDALSGKSFSGVVSGIGAQVDQASGTIPVAVQVQNENLLLKDDMVATGKIILGESKALLVPESAILSDPSTDKKNVVLVGSDGTARIVPVHVSSAGLSETRVGISGKVRAGDRVAVSGQYALPDGTKVKPVQAGNP